MAVQRVYGAVFSLQMKADIPLEKALGSTEAVKELLYKMVNVFKFKPMLTEELGTQLVKNVTFLLKAVISDTSIEFQLGKLFARCSFLARKMMLNVSEAKERIAHVLLFFQVALHLFEAHHNESETDDNLSARDNPMSRSVVSPILELVYRIYTDD